MKTYLWNVVAVFPRSVDVRLPFGTALTFYKVRGFWYRPTFWDDYPYDLKGEPMDDQASYRKTVIWAAIILSGVYFLCQILADVAAAKLVEVFGLTMPGGTFVFALTFTLRDVFQKNFGKRTSQMIIIAAAAFNVLMVLYFQWVAKLPYPPFYENQDAFMSILGVAVPRIAVASIIAEIVSELIDTEIYSAWVRRFGERFQWGRVLSSNLVALPIDSLLFGLLAFYGIHDLNHIWEIVQGQTIVKAVIAVASIPLIYITRRVRFEDTEEFQYADAAS